MHNLKPRTVLISHVYSDDNKGDAALTSILISDVRRTFPKARLTILRLESIKKESYFEGVPERPSFMYYVANRYRHPLAKLLYVFGMIPATLLWAWWRRYTGRNMRLPEHLREIVRLYDKADLVIAVGGGYIRSRPGLLMRWNVPLLLHSLFFAYLLGKPTVLYSQSVGPFMYGYERRLAASVLKKMLLIMTREETSRDLLRELGVQNNVARTVDCGFLLEGRGKPNLRKRYGIQQTQPLIGVTVRSWLQGQAQADYEAAVAESLDEMIRRHDAAVVFIPQVTATKGDDDRQVAKRVYSLMQRRKHAHVITDTPDHHEVKAMYDELDLLLGTRFHSVIFSLTSYVPVVAIEYEHKTSGIMRDIGLGEWVIGIEKITAADLTVLLEKAFTEQTEYRAHLHRYLPSYVSRARENAHLLAARYAGWAARQTELEKP